MHLYIAIYAIFTRGFTYKAQPAHIFCYLIETTNQGDWQ